MIIHVRIRLIRRESRELHSVLSQELAELDAWIGILASLRSVPILVKDVVLINVHWSLLNHIEIHVSEDTGCFPHASNKAGADQGVSIVVFPSVLPAVLLSNHENIGEVHASLVGLNCNLGNVKTLRSQMEVQGLSQKDVGGVFVNFLYQSKGWPKQRFWHQERKVVVRSVSERHQEIVVTVWQSLMLKEVLLSSSLVELGPSFLT